MKRKSKSYFSCIQDRQYEEGHNRLLPQALRDSRSLLQRLQLSSRIEAHTGCVNSLAWNETGSLLLSGSDDHNLVLSDPFLSRPVTVVNTPHTANIFSAKFLPGTGDSKLVSCAGDGLIAYADLHRIQDTAGCTFHCHSGTVYELSSVPGDPHTFLSCGEDGTVRWFDTRTKTSCSREDCQEDILILCQRGVSSISINPFLPCQLAVGCSDASVRIYDRRMLGTRLTGSSDNSSGLTALVTKFTVPEFEGAHRRITSVDFRKDGQEVLASYSSDYIYIFDPKESREGKGKKLKVGRPAKKKLSARGRTRSPLPMKKLRLRGDWSDTGPNSRPETEIRQGAEGRGESAEVDRNSVQAQLLQRMTEALSRMLNDPGTRLAMQRLNGTEERTVSETSNSGEESSPDAPDPPQNARLGEAENVVEDIRDSLNLTESSAAATIQERWRRFRERKLQSLRQTTMESTAHEQGAESAVADAVAVQEAAVPTEEIEKSSSAGQSAESKTENDEQSASMEQEELNNPEIIGDLDRPGDPQAERSSDLGTSGSSLSVCDAPAVRTESENWSQEAVPCDFSEDGVVGEDGGVQGGSIESLETSYSNLRDNGVEPTLQLRYRSQGPAASWISVGGGPSELLVPLPGPSRVVTGPGQVAFDPVTGARRRRTGISSVPTSVILPDDREAASTSSGKNTGGKTSCRAMEDSGVIEYEAESDDDMIEDDEEEDRDDDGRKSSRRGMTGRTILQPPVRSRLTGHRNARTMIKEATWWGNNFVLSGSDCGHLFGWDRRTGEMVLMLEADRHVVNCVAPHPSLPLLATSGIDYDIKIWQPTAETSQFDSKAAGIVSRRNEVMLEETRDTITVPASLMIRMLASLNQIRRGQPAGGQRP